MFLGEDVDIDKRADQGCGQLAPWGEFESRTRRISFLPARRSLRSQQAARFYLQLTTARLLLV